MRRLRFPKGVAEHVFEEKVREHEFWYHSYYFDNGFEVRGDYDIGRNVEAYGFPDDMTGMEVLDVGTGSGWFSFFFEQRGARVTAVDARGYCDFDFVGRYEYPSLESEKPVPDRVGPGGEPLYDSPVSGGFWIMRDLLGSQVQFVNSTVYGLSPELFGGKRFDLVFMGAVLPHVRDPIGALMAARRVCGDRLIASTMMMPEWRALGELVRGPRVGAAVALARRALRRTPLPEENPLPMMDLVHAMHDPIAWWRPNIACFRQWFVTAGFSRVDVSRETTLTSDVLKPLDADAERLRNVTKVLRVGDCRI